MINQIAAKYPQTLNFSDKLKAGLATIAVSKEVIFLGFVLAALQIADGVLTALGVSKLGTGVEGNVLIRALMDQIGYIPALCVVKLVALFVILGICLLSSKVQWLSKAMKCIIAIYLGAAVLPWSFIIVKHIL